MRIGPSAFILLLQMIEINLKKFISDCSILLTHQLFILPREIYIPLLAGRAVGLPGICLCQRIQVCGVGEDFARWSPNLGRRQRLLTTELAGGFLFSPCCSGVP